MNTRPLVTLVPLILLLALAPCAAGQTTITLKHSGTVAARTAVTLGEVASLEGPDAQRLSATVVLGAADARPPAGAGRMDIDIAQVRAALEAAGVNWGRTALRGSSCSLRLIEDEHAPKPPPDRAPAPAAPVAKGIDLNGAATVRVCIASRLAQLFGVQPEDLRIKFRPEDEALLGTPTASRRVDVQPSASASSPRLPVQVYVYAGDRIVASGTVTAEVLVRREVYSAAAPIERGDVINAEMITASLQWLEPSGRAAAPGARIVGSIARNRLGAGAVLSLDDVEAPLAAKRGDLVYVHCLSGSVNVKAKARVLADARDGQLVQLRLDGSKKTFTARMSGQGRAVMTLDPSAQ